MLSFRTCWILSVILPLICINSALSFEHCETYEWYKFGENCYLFENKDRLFSFYDAEDYCRSKGSYLASIHSKEESEFLDQVMQKQGGRRWIGLNTLDISGKQQWSDGSVVDFLDLYNKTQYKVEKCYIFFYSNGFRPEHCELRYIPICKKPYGVIPPTIQPITPITPEGNCPQDWLQYGQKCYKFFGQKEEDRKQFKDAKLACMALGNNHDLATVHSMSEQAFLTQQLADFGSSPWIGLSYVESDQIGHVMVFGWTDNARVNFTYYSPGHPPRGTWKYCVRLEYQGLAKGEWVADYCQLDKKGYICQRPPNASLPPQPPKQSTCDKDSEGYRGSCYKFHSTPKSWYDAEEFCKSTGSHLVSVTDGLEQAFLFNFLNGKAKHVWNGLKTVKGTRIIWWSDNEPLYFTKWRTVNGEELNGYRQPSTEEDTCTFMVPSDELYWNMTTDCKARLPFVCETSDRELPDPTDIFGDCPSGESSWIDIGDQYCYHTGETARMSWAPLSRYCISKGMEMITLNSNHQTDLLKAYFWHTAYNYWIGLIKTFDKKSFMWIDNSPLNYTNWDEREPSTWSDSECATFSSRTAKWSVTGCNDWAGAICRAKKTIH